jgi:TonB family protein
MALEGQAGREPLYNEKEKTIEKLEKAGQKMARKPGTTEPGEKPLYKTGKPGEKPPWITSFVKGNLSNSLTGVSADASIQEAVVNIDGVLGAIVRPDYDEAAKTAGAQGSVRIRFVVDETGRVESMNAEEGNAPFLERARAGTKQIRFRPLVRDGKALRNEGTITFRFRLLPAQSEAAESDATMARPVKRAPAQGDAKPAPPVKPAPAEGPAVPRPAKLESSIGTRKTESLGKQIIEGIEAEGTRSTLTIAAGEIGNRLPIGSPMNAGTSRVADDADGEASRPAFRRHHLSAY